MEWLQDEIRTAAHAFATQLRSIDKTSVIVPGLEWDVAELAAHLISLPRVYQQLNEAGTSFTPPSDWARFSLATRAHIRETDADRLADEVLVETEGFLHDLGHDGNEVRWAYNQQTSAAGVAAGFLGELILHGQDLARLTVATPLKLDRRVANAIVDQHLILAPAFVDPIRAAKCPGVYHLRFRGGDDYTFAVADKQLTVSRGRPTKPDCHVVADPAAFVMVSLGRTSTIRAGLLGKIVGYGRKPWKLLALGKIRVDGV